MDIQQINADLKASGCKTLEDWTGCKTYNEFEKLILQEYGDESEQAKRYGMGVFKIKIQDF